MKGEERRGEERRTLVKDIQLVIQTPPDLVGWLVGWRPEDE